MYLDNWAIIERANSDAKHLDRFVKALKSCGYSRSPIHSSLESYFGIVMQTLYGTLVSELRRASCAKSALVSKPPRAASPHITADIPAGSRPSFSR